MLAGASGAVADRAEKALALNIEGYLAQVGGKGKNRLKTKRALGSGLWALGKNKE
jgi:hypothetical protein